MRRALACLIALALLCTASPAAAEAAAPRRDWGAIFVDVPIVRLLSFAATAVGCGLFVVSLPFTAPFRVVREAADQLVLEPGRYTFTRPVGQL